ncbi:MAG: trypsin-like serine protease [Actinomycetota bacterium]|jgi:V8-like Glu-specific endopeptidase|nr:trypsin-like serine protease [Actinomycetota bacterium]
MRRLFLLLTIAAMVLVVALPAAAITYGQPDRNRHPEVGGLVVTVDTGQRFAYCSGTLIAPRMFLTAAHCGGQDRVDVTFNSVVDEGSVLHRGTFHPNPAYPGRAGDIADIAVVVFDKPVTGISPARLPKANQLSLMKADKRLNQRTRFTSVGYGSQEFVNAPGGKQPTFPGPHDIRQFAAGSFNALNKNWLRLTQNPATGDAGTCYGDSGGPNFLGAGATETNIIAGLTVTGDRYCRSTNTTYRLDSASARTFLRDFVALP